MLITGLYAALLALLALALAANVVRARYRSGVAFGDGDDLHLQKCQRVHGNFLEYVPLALLMLLVLELSGMPGWQIHLYGVVLVVARLLHAWGLGHSTGTSFGRFTGTALTWLVMLAMSCVLLGGWLMTAI